MPQGNLRELFLRKFIKELINNSDFEPIVTDKENNEEIRPKKEIKEKISPIIPKKFMPINATNLTNIQKRPLINNLSTKKIINSKRKSLPIPLSSPTEGYPELGKLNSLVSDAGVEGIECLGSDKNILVKKGGRVQRTSIILKKEEIKKILQDFSQQTKIPLTRGTFKAVLGNIILTAVLSEFVGTKFILQKKNPVLFQEPL